MLEPEGSSKGSPAHREIKARRCGVQVCTATRRRTVGIGYDGGAVRIRAGDDPQQLALRGPLAATDAGPDRPRRGGGIRACVNVVSANHFWGV